jgi:GPH family glycoside/pentoside/hexuronide:cation symporter
MEKNTQTHKLSFWEKCAFGLGDTGCNFFWALISLTGLFYTDYFGITATAVGTMMLLVRLLDIGFDVIIGVYADRTRTKYGRFRPWILYGAAPFAVCAFFTYFTPELADPAKLVYAYITFTLFVFMYSVVDVPYGALLGVISPVPEERTKASAYKMIFAHLGGFFVYGFTLPVVEQLSKTYTPQISFSIIAFVYAVVGFILLMTCFYFTKERVEPVKEEKNKLSEDFGDLIKNKPWILLTVAGIMLLFFQFIHAAIIPYYAKYYVATFTGENQFEISGTVFGFNISWEVFTAVLITSGSLLAILGTIMIEPVVVKYGKKNTWIVCFVLASICSAAFYFVPKDALFTIMLLQVLFTLAIGPTGFIMWSMYADVADDSEVKTGRRATGLIYASATMAQKLGGATSQSIPLLMLGAIGFIANQSMDADTQQSLVKIFAFLPIVASAIAVVALFFYNIDEKTIQENSDKLVAMKAEKEGK